MKIEKLREISRTVGIGRNITRRVSHDSTRVETATNSMTITPVNPEKSLDESGERKYSEEDYRRKCLDVSLINSISSEKVSSKKQCSGKNLPNTTKDLSELYPDKS